MLGFEAIEVLGQLSNHDGLESVGGNVVHFGLNERGRVAKNPGQVQPGALSPTPKRREFGSDFQRPKGAEKAPGRAPEERPEAPMGACRRGSGTHQRLPAATRDDRGCAGRRGRRSPRSCG
jgi:hypothetical protein